MSSQFLSLEEAAKKLGVTTDQLVAYRSEGKIRGFRDGASWKFPAGEIDRLADDLAGESGSYDPYKGFDDEGGEAGASGVLGDEAAGSDVGSGGSSRLGSDVNLVAGDDDGSDVKVVTSSDDDESDFMLKGKRENLEELDSGELTLSPSEPAITHDSELLDLSAEQKQAIAREKAEKAKPAEPASGDSGFDIDSDDDDSGDEVLGASDVDDLLSGSKASGAGSKSGAGALSSLELMDELDDAAAGSSGKGAGGSDSGNVLSELDMLGAEAGGSGLIQGDSGNVIGSDLIGSDIGSAGGSSKGSGLAIDDDDDDLLITDDEEDLVLEGSDLSVAGDSGINLMSPSDSGISLESEPLDLAGSSISALDLASELGSDIGGGSSGKGVGSGGDEFQLSPSGISIDNESDSSSQVIEVEDSAAFVEADEMDAGAFGEPIEGDEAFAEEAEGGFGEEEEAFGVEEGFDEESAERVGAAVPVAYEKPYSVWEVAGLACTALALCLGGMITSDLIRNIWTYAEPAAPVSGFTDWLIDISPFGG